MRVPAHIYHELQSVDPVVLKPKLLLNESPRLAVILAYSERAQQAMLRIPTGLTREQMYRNETLDSFWSNIVTPTFMTETRIQTVSFTGVLDDVDASTKPRARRDGVELKNRYYDSRPYFTTSYER